MKFSYTLIKKLVPQVKSKAQVIEALTMHAFEAEDVSRDTFDVKLPPNRYSDGASHWGIAREISAILNLKAKFPGGNTIRESDFSKFKIKVLDKKLCPRYSVEYFENISVKPSPEWVQKVLIDCGLRPINNVVDIMNYVMLETGQPLHAFDYDKLEGKTLLVRRAKRGESINSIDGVKYKLDPSMLVIADRGRAQAIAGIKGGKGAEVTSKTKRIIVESANFESSGIYRTSRAINLSTDASLRFSHNLSPHLTLIGLERASLLISEIVGGRAGARFDSLTKPVPKKMIKFNQESFNKLIGLNLDLKTVVGYLKRLGFIFKDNKFEVPLLRQDIENHEDLAEEVLRLYGLNKLKPELPQVALRSSESDEMFLFRDKIRRILVGLGLSEVRSHSFLSERGVNHFKKVVISIKNPISEEWAYLRPSLLPALVSVARENSKNFDFIKVFETGRAFRLEKNKAQERNSLGVVLSSKKEESIFELKGLVDEILKGLGIVDFAFEPVAEPKKDSWLYGFVKNITEANSFVRVVIGKEIVGWFGKEKESDDWHTSLFEINLDKLLLYTKEEREYEPMLKYPSVMRDVSILVNNEERIGDIMEGIQNLNLHLIQDVDLIDEYSDDRWENLQSLTFRIVFQRDDRTLTNGEVDKEMKKIVSFLQSKFKAQVR